MIESEFTGERDRSSIAGAIKALRAIDIVLKHSDAFDDLQLFYLGVDGLLAKGLEALSPIGFRTVFWNAGNAALFDLSKYDARYGVRQVWFEPYYVWRFLFRVFEFLISFDHSNAKLYLRVINIPALQREVLWLHNPDDPRGDVFEIGVPGPPLGPGDVMRSDEFLKLLIEEAREYRRNNLE